MSKKLTKKDQSKKQVQLLIEENLSSLLLSLNPGINLKKVKKTSRKAGKIISKAIKLPSKSKASKDAVPDIIVL